MDKENQTEKSKENSVDTSITKQISQNEQASQKENGQPKLQSEGSGQFGKFRDSCKSFFRWSKKILTSGREVLSNKSAKIIAAVLICALICSTLLNYLPVPVVLRLGIFSTSNWNVPESSTYAIVDDVIERFEAQNPHIRVEYDSGIIRDDYSDWLSDKIVEGTLPDVFMVLDEDFNMLASLGALKNLNGLIASDPEFDQKDFYQNAFCAGQYDHVQFALPYQCNLQLMFVNTTLLDQQEIEIPKKDWTLNDFQKIAMKMTMDLDHDGIIDISGFTGYGWLDVVEAYGHKLFNESGCRADINNDEVKQALRFMQQMQSYNQEHVSSNMGGFDSGTVVFAPMSYAEYKTYRPYPWKVKKYSAFEWDMLPMPSVQKDGQRSVLESLLMGISSRSKHPKAAWKLLKAFVCDEQTQTSVVRLSGAISPLLSVTLTQQSEDSPNDAAGLLDYAIEHAAGKTRFRKYEDVMRLLDTGMNDILQSENDIDLQLLELQRQADAFLRE